MRLALKRRGDTQLLGQVLRATKCDKLSEGLLFFLSVLLMLAGIGLSLGGVELVVWQEWQWLRLGVWPLFPLSRTALLLLPADSPLCRCPLAPP